MSVYCIQGGGHERLIPFDKRVAVPDGTTLVVFTPPATELDSPVFCKFMDYFNDKRNAAILADPSKHKPTMKKLFPNVRIYKAGYKMPELYTSLSVIHDGIQVSFEKSGVFDIKTGVPEFNAPSVDLGNAPTSPQHMSAGPNPISPLKLNAPPLPFAAPDVHVLPSQDMFTDDNPEDFCYRYRTYTQQYSREIHKQMYNGSIRIPRYTPDVTEMARKRYKLSTLMASIGPGVFYYGGCRYVPTNSDLEKLSIKVYDIVSQLGDEASIKRYKMRLNLVMNGRTSVYFYDELREISALLMKTPHVSDESKTYLREFLVQTEEIANRYRGAFEASAEQQNSAQRLRASKRASKRPPQQTKYTSTGKKARLSQEQPVELLFRGLRLEDATLR